MFSIEQVSTRDTKFLEVEHRFFSFLMTLLIILIGEVI